MIDVTKRAAREISKRFARGSTPVFVRVSAQSTGDRPILSLHPSAPLASDETLELDGVILLVDSDLVADLGGVKIGFDDSPRGEGWLFVSPVSASMTT